VILDKEAEFDRVVIPTPACVSIVVFSHKRETDKNAHLAPERCRGPLRVLDAVADQFVDSPGQSDAAIHRSTTTADFVPRPRRPCHVAYTVKREAGRPIQELLDRGLVCPSDSPRASPSVRVANEDRGGRIACDYRDLNLMYSYAFILLFVLLCLCIRSICIYSACSALCCTKTDLRIIPCRSILCIVRLYICRCKRYCV